MTCLAYVLTGVGLDLMHLLGWVSLHDTHHRMGFLRKNFGSWYFWVCRFLGCYKYSILLWWQDKHGVSSLGLHLFATRF
jgi:hypothetical protein